MPASPTPPPGGPEPDSIAERLKQQFGDDIGPTLPLDPEPAPDKDAPSTLFDKLRGAGTRGSRYRLLGEVARGGMGVILKIWDDELRRTLAMKVVLGRGDESKGDTPHVDPKTLGRFLEEAQVTGQLDHPGIVPVHELGLGADGHVYFTMRLVKGEDLSKIYARARSGEEGWTQLRALGVVLKVCEAMSYAHSKHVIHRDLKPANVMVGKFGEVYVMDWGLARVLGREDKHDLHIQSQPTTQSVVKTDRREGRDETPDSPLVTMDGDIVGTPSFMPPEQAQGMLGELGPHSDVYSVGAMLYALLAGTMPYVPSGARVSARTILISVLNGPPKPLFELAPQTPAELIAIVEKAMARDIGERYSTMQALAEDLRAFIEGRVVRAYETGTWAEAKKWVQRNRPLTSALVAAVVILIVGIVTSISYGSRASARAADAVLARNDLKVKNSELQGANAALVEAKTRAEQETNDVLSLSAQADLDDMTVRADMLWPAHPEMIPQYEEWLAAAHELIDGRPADPSKGVKKRLSLEEHKAKLAELRTRAKPPTAVQEVSERRTFDYDDPEARWWDVQLAKLVADLEQLRDPQTGLMSDAISSSFGWGVEKRYKFAKQIAERSVDGAAAKRLWSEAIVSIKSSPKYGGLELTPQMGLLPIGMDLDSGLWEFAHLQTGDPAQRGADEKLVLTEETGLVFVLIPGGAFWMGAQKTDESGHNFDRGAEANESPVKELTLEDYFLSKYEMTQGQWLRFVGRNPSTYGPGTKFGDKPCSLLNPVEHVSWNNCTEALSRLGLVLPTEAQWEYGARAGTTSPWCTGAEKETIAGAANLADSYCKVNGGPSNWMYEEWLDDGWAVHAPAGSYRANAFGLHDMIGNVWEWCRDAYGGYELPTHAGDGERIVIGSTSLVNRGGSFYDAASLAHSAYRNAGMPDFKRNSLGLRPARGLTP